MMALKQHGKGRRFDELRAFVVPKAKAFVVPKAKLVQKSVWNRSFVCNAAKTIGLVLFYYSFSITLTFYNQRFIHVSSARHLHRIVSIHRRLDHYI